jgi:hypothetical protein
MSDPILLIKRAVSTAATRSFVPVRLPSAPEHAPGLLRRHAGSEVVFRAQRDVGLKFGIDVAVDPRAVQQISHTAENGHRARLSHA